MLLELAVKGSGAATVDSFFSHFLQTMMRVGGNKRSADEVIDHLVSPIVSISFGSLSRIGFITAPLSSYTP